MTRPGPGRRRRGGRPYCVHWRARGPLWRRHRRWVHRSLTRHVLRPSPPTRASPCTSGARRPRPAPHRRGIQYKAVARALRAAVAGRPRRRHTERQGCALTTTGHPFYAAASAAAHRSAPHPGRDLGGRGVGGAWWVPVDVAPLEHGWVVVVPAGRDGCRAAVRRPGRPPGQPPVPARMRPAIGLVVRGGEAVVCVAARGWRSGRRWLAWSPGEGLVPPGGLPPLAAQPVAASGVADPGALDALRAVGSDVAGAPGTSRRPPRGARPARRQAARRVGPGRRRRAVPVLPDGRAVAGFEGAVHEERLWHEELGL